MVAAIQTAYPEIGQKTLPLLHEPQPLPVETILSTLINELSALPDLLTLVLDDYHVIESPDIHQGLAFLVEHLPSHMHLVMTTRTDPPLPLARMRVRNQLLELRSTDLRFSQVEIVTFFSDVMELTLTTDEVKALDTRVEGWIAGLQLAGLALQGKCDTAEFIASFAGDHHYVLDYLGDEILDRQPEAIQQFLLQTSILERLNANLCDSIMSVMDRQAVLEHLERHHFFVVALDDKRQWYRYHRLFADFLHHRLKLKYPDRVKILHQRASQWFEGNGLQSEAIAHAFAAQDNERAAELVQGISELLIWRRAEHNTLLGWLTALPESVLQKYPRLYLYHAWVLYLINQMSGAEQRIRDAKNALNHLNTTDPLIAGMLAAVHSTLTGIHHQFPETLILSRQALKQLPEDAVSWRCMAAINLGVTCAYIGEVQEAVEVLSYAMELSQEIGSSFAMLSAFWHLSSLQIAQLRLRASENTCQQLEQAAEMPGLQRFPINGYMTRGGASGFVGLASWMSGKLETAHRTFADVINGANTLAMIQIGQGRLHEAMRTYEQGLKLATGQGMSAIRGTADMYVGMSEIYREWNNLDTASQHLLKSQELGEYSSFPQNQYRWHIAMARLLEAQNDLEGALSRLDEAERIYMSDFSPNIRPIAALKARIWIRQGKLDEALDWAQEQGLSTHDDLSYVREFAHITLVRLLLARYRRDSVENFMRLSICWNACFKQQKRGVVSGALLKFGFCKPLFSRCTVVLRTLW